MREIKFRAWIKSQKKWYPQSDLKWFPLRALMNEDGCSDDLIFVEYTGLKDRDGKEIWEGDIVRYWQKWWSMGTFKVSKVEFAEGRFYTGEGQCEVIGNIYENPKLV